MSVPHLKLNVTIIRWSIIMITHIDVSSGQNVTIKKLLYSCGFTVMLISFVMGNLCTDNRKCELSESGMKLTCSGEISDPYITGGNSNTVTLLSLCNWSTDGFDPDSILRLFPSLEEIIVTHSNITRLLSTFKMGLNLRKITLSDLQLKNISKNTFQGLQNVQLIDLKRNHLQHIDEEIFLHLPRLEEVYLAENKWQCTGRMTWLLKSSLVTKIRDLNQLVCAKYDRKPLFLIMQFLQTLELQCPAECSCIMDHVAWSYHEKASLLPFHTVNCSYRGLDDFPATLPGNTTTLFLQGNKIRSIEALATNPTYSNLKDVYLDNNQIQSINALEGSNWLFTFRVLSLRENLITEIPVYALDDAFEKNSQLARLLLGRNPWHCECTFILSFQELMKKHMNIFRDIEDIKCAYIDGGDNSLSVINNLEITDVCKEPIIGLHRLTGLDILNISLASLIILILGKLLYDYLTFKKTGKLPWIVMKMP